MQTDRRKLRRYIGLLRRVSAASLYAYIQREQRYASIIDSRQRTATYKARRVVCASMTAWAKRTYAENATLGGDVYALWRSMADFVVYTD